MANDLPTNFLVFTRDGLAEIGRKAWRIRHHQQRPDQPLDIGPKTLPYLVTQVFADMIGPAMADAVMLARAYLIRQTFGDRLVRRADELGLTPLPATPASGFIIADKIAAAGATIDKGTELLHVPTGQKFQVQGSVGKTYQDQAPIPITGTTLGPTSNLAVGAVLVFTNPPGGVSNTATVEAQADGTGNTVGLTGGRDPETDAELQARMIDRLSNPPASGNAADIIYQVEKIVDVPVQKAWVIPAISGPGTVSVLFTVRPDPRTGSRIPNSVQIGQVEANLTSIFPADFGITVCTLQSVTAYVILRVTWRAGVSGWADGTPWPPVGPQPTFPIVTWANVWVLPSPAPTTGGARLACQVLDPSTQVAAGIPSPLPGQTIGFFDVPSKTFKRKRILTVNQLNVFTWDVTFDATAGASDTYVPNAYQGVSAWSDSLNSLPAAVYAVFAAMGPGEQVTTFPDPGTRQRRQPRSPDVWASILSNADIVGAAKGTGVVGDVVFEWPPTPFLTTVGVPAVYSNLLELGDLVVSFQ
jgi:hypothetical protein